MNKHQIKVLRRVLKRDKNIYFGENLNIPLIGKHINEVSVNGKLILKNKKLYNAYRLFKGTNIYDQYSINFKFSSTLYIITKNDIVIYWVTSNIYAPALSAWRILTEVYHGYGEGFRSGCWTWKSVDDFECIDLFWDNRDILKTCNYTLTDYQRKKFEETGRYYIDKTTISSQEAALIANNEYCHF